MNNLRTNRRNFMAPIISAAFFSTISSPTLAKALDKNSIIEGDGAPSIVFIHGLDADIFASFKKIIPFVSPKYKTIAFNRKGYGSVKYSGENRSGKIVAQEIYQSLKENNIKPPYIIVGHSLGGVYAEFFAKIYPSETTGLLIIDPMVEGQIEFLKKNYADAFSMMNLIMGLSRKAVRKEYEASNKLHEEIKTLNNYNGKTIIMFSTKIQGLENADSYVEFRRQKLIALANSYNTKLQVFNCGHFIQNEQPQDVANAINEIALATQIVK